MDVHKILEALKDERENVLAAIRVLERYVIVHETRRNSEGWKLIVRESGAPKAAAVKLKRRMGRPPGSKNKKTKRVR